MYRSLTYRRFRLIVAVLAAAALAAAALAATPAAQARATGGFSPAIGAHPHYTVVGQVRPQTPRTFGCQVPAPGGLHCYAPAQIRAAYGIDKVHATGAGTTIAIVDAYQSPTAAYDLALFSSVFELPAANLQIVAPDGLTPFDPNDANQVGWAGEITLDIEWAHAIAPAAKILLVLAKSNNDADILSATKYVVDHNAADVISQSFGEAEQCMDPAVFNQQTALFAQATRKHITLLASSGDQGAAQPTCDGTSFFQAASTPATDPNVTAVGGTILHADGRTGAYQGETVWNEPDFAVAGGGGFSVKFATPAYQEHQHVRSRGVPDVAYNAAIDGGVLAVFSSSGQGANLVFIFGGTSAGSPQWAGLVSLAVQLRHSRLGAINPALYAITRSPKVYGALFHDITVGDNTYHGGVTVPGFTAKPGWDAASGLGSPKANAVVPALALVG
jgi:subtilase family serine protease